jgi:hypothetical protein
LKTPGQPFLLLCLRGKMLAAQLLFQECGKMLDVSLQPHIEYCLPFPCWDWKVKVDEDGTDFGFFSAAGRSSRSRRVILILFLRSWLEGLGELSNDRLSPGYLERCPGDNEQVRLLSSLRRDHGSLAFRFTAYRRIILDSDPRATLYAKKISPDTFPYYLSLRVCFSIENNRGPEVTNAPFPFPDKSPRGFEPFAAGASHYGPTAKITQVRL